MQRVVISLGGSVLIPTIEENRIGAYALVLCTIAKTAHLFIVVGGGGEARRYINAARGLGVDEGTADEIGILVTRLNATLLIAALGDAAYPAVATCQTEAICFGEGGDIVVMGGVTPAQTTDAVAAVLAERLGAALFVNVSAVDGVYTADPRKDPSAEKFFAMTPEELLTVIQNAPLPAGANTVIDLVAAKVVARSGIPLLVLDGREPEALSRALLSGDFSGTVVSRDGSVPFPL
jgi:uridylate kinase